MAERRLRMRLGLFVGATLAVLAGLVVLFGAAPGLFSAKAAYTLLFPEAPAVGPGTPIRKSGVRIGEVTTVDLDPATGLVRVAVRVDPKYPPRTGEDPTITRGFLSGDTAIDFLPKLGPDGQPVGRGVDYPPGSEISGVPPVTARSLLTPASGVLASAQTSLDRMVASFERLEKVAPQLERTLQEFEHLAHDVRLFIPELKKTNDRIRNFIGVDADGPGLPAGMVAAQAGPPPENLRTLIRDIRALLATVQPAVDELRATVKRLEPEVSATAKSARAVFDKAGTAVDAINDVLSPENRKQINELVKNLNGIGVTVLRLAGGFQNLLDEAQKAVQNFDRRIAPVDDILADIRKVTRPLSERSEAVVKDVAESAASLNKVLTEVREVVRAFAREDGTLQKLLTEQGLYQNLDAAAAALARVLHRAEAIGQDLGVFADKVARRPELIGVGGAVRGSSGLKESPFAPAPVPPGLPSYRPDWPPSANPKSVQGLPVRP